MGVFVMPRDYTKERLAERPERVKERAKRNKARRELMREGKVSKGDGKVVDHKRPLTKGGSTARANLKVQSAKASHSQGGKLQPKAGKAKGGRN
jgi:5-methylcytosine-specific restriction endonuclease McrA